MDLEPFRALLDDPNRSQADLMVMRTNALDRNAVGHVHAAETALDKRFPGWRTVRSRRGGRKATDVEFRGRKEHHATEKEAYVWLLERFIERYPKPFVELDWETVFVAIGPRAAYFAKSVERLFGAHHQHLAADRNNWVRLSNGWYAKLVLSEVQKLALLLKFGGVAGLLFGVDWDWNGRGRANPQQSADDILREMETL